MDRLGREIVAAICWGLAAYLLTSVRIELPGPLAFHTDFTEVALLGSALFLSRPWLAVIACAVEALNVVPPATLPLSFETTFLMHAVAVPFAWYAHRALARRDLSHLALGASWCGFVVVYYFALLMPMLLLTSPLIPPSLEPPVTSADGWLAAYWRVARALPYEVLFTAGITALTFVTKEELRRRRRIEGDLRATLQAQRAMLDAAPMAVIRLAGDGNVATWNPAAERLFGQPASRAIGGPAPRMRKSAESGGESMIEPLLSGMPLLAVEGEVEAVGGAIVPVSLFGAPLRDDSGSTAGAVLLVEDLREQLALRSQVQRSATMSALGQLVGGLAHELRNPLFGITAALDAFGQHLVGNSRLELMDRTLRGQVGQLNALVIDLLDYGKAATAGERITASLELPLRHALNDCAAQATAAAATLEVAMSPGLPLVRMDASRLVQVFRNLIQNALAFSPPGAAVRIEGSREADGPRDTIRVEVLDRGRGFEPDDIAKVFEPFFSRRSGGTGLGLSIVRRIVEHHGGTIEAGNRTGGGARMVVRLPAEPAQTG